MSLKVDIKITHNGPKAKDFTKEELEVLDVENLQETYYEVTFNYSDTKSKNKDIELEDIDNIGIAELLKLETKLPMKYLKPIQNSCIYVAQKARISSNQDKNIENASVMIEPMNPDWVNGKVRFLLINQSIPLDTIFMISKSIPYDGNYEWVTSDDIQSIKPLKDLILSENPKAKSFVLTVKTYLFGQDIGSKLEGKFKVAMTDDVFDNLRLFRFKRPSNNKLIFIIYDFTNITLKDILTKAKSVCKNKEGKRIIDLILNNIKD